MRYEYYTLVLFIGPAHIFVLSIYTVERGATEKGKEGRKRRNEIEVEDVVQWAEMSSRK